MTSYSHDVLLSIGAGILLLLLLSTALVHYRDGAFSDVSDSAFIALDEREQYAYLTSYAKRDPDGAWAFLVRILADTRAKVNGHGMGHIIGKELYEKYGETAMRHCTIDFGFACFHGVSAQSLLLKGEKAAQELVDACTASFPTDADGQGVGYVHACVHGLGHGIATAEGLDIGNALSVCEALRTESAAYERYDIRTDAAAACAEGIFMEVLTDAKVGPETNPWTLCERVSASYARACTRYATIQPQHISSLNTFSAVISFCASAPSDDLRDGCLNESALLTLALTDDALAYPASPEALAYLGDSCKKADGAFYRRCVEVSAGFLAVSSGVRSDNAPRATAQELRGLFKALCAPLQEKAQACAARAEFLQHAFGPSRPQYDE